MTQKDIGIRGWAVENRVYAEDPFKNFGMPSIGRLFKYEEPKGQGVRCDSGIEEGSEISMFYDPMICKLTNYAPTRQEAIESAVIALDNYVIRGVTHNIPLLRDVLRDKRFLQGDFTTNYLPETYPEGFKGKQLNEKEVYDLAIIAAVFSTKFSIRDQIMLNESSIKNDPTSVKGWSFVVSLAGKDVPVYVDFGKGGFLATVAGSEPVKVEDNFNLADSVVQATLNDESTAVQLISRQANGQLRIRYHGTAMDIPVFPGHVAELKVHMKEKPKLDTSKLIMSPMPGVVRAVSVELGQIVGEGLGE